MKLILIVCLLFVTNATAQSDKIKDFDAPIKIPLLVSGSFGELRSNHFHAGTDFSANYKIGDPVYAPADGVVNRIKVSTFGYGKALYIRHNNGYITVYVHLNDYSQKIDQYIKERQYQKQQFEIELFPLANELVVKKGEIIGYIGNTGGSGGPHLHYEIRDTKTEHILNALEISLKDQVMDTEQPIINGIYVYPLTDETVIDGTNQFFEIALHKKNNQYVSSEIRAKGSVGIGINTHDTQNNSRGKNGVYKIVTFINGTKSFEVIFDEFSFNETRHINHFIDYKYYKQTGKRIQKLFIINDLPLSLIKSHKNKGVLDLNQNGAVNFRIEVFDAHMNKQVIELPFTFFDYESMTSEKNDGKYIDYLKDYVFEEENVAVEWDARTFYEDHYLEVDFMKNGVKLHRDVFPTQRNINVKILVPEDYPNKDQTFIGLVDNGKIRYFDTWKRGNDFRIRTRQLGTYQLVQDTLPPSVRFINSQDHFSEEDHLVFEIQDDLSGIGSYNGFLNDEWVLFEYDYKTKKIVHKLKDKKYTTGNNVLRLEISDRMGNNAKFEQIITVTP